MFEDSLGGTKGITGQHLGVSAHTVADLVEVTPRLRGEVAKEGFKALELGFGLGVEPPDFKDQEPNGFCGVSRFEIATGRGFIRR